MTTNATPDPWAPDANHKPGEPGERGSSAFAGNTQFSAPSSNPNQGSTRAIGGEYGDAPTRYSDPNAAISIIVTPLSNQAGVDARATARNTAAAAASA